MQNRIKNFINGQHNILPIINLDDKKHQADDVIAIITALRESHINTAEITLRSRIAMQALALAKENFPDFLLCAGSVRNTVQIEQLKEVAVEFIITPGITEELLTCSKENHIDILPGVMTPSDILLGLQHNIHFFKFFPAATSTTTTENITAITAPFPECHFLATGGIHANNAKDFLHLHNVFGIATSYIADSETIQHKKWQTITEKAKQFSALREL